MVRVTNDLLFRKMLSSEENKDVLQGFIQDFCGLAVTFDEIHIVTPYSIKSYKEAAGSIDNMMRLIERDVAVQLRILDVVVELQMYKDNYFIARALHYVFDRYCSNYNVPGSMDQDMAGNMRRHSSLRPVYAVNIMSNTVFPDDDDAMRVFTLYDKEHCSGLDREWIWIGFFELGKSNFRTDNQRHWREFLLTGVAPVGSPDYIQKAQGVVDYANLDEEEREMLTAVQKFEDNYSSVVVTAFEDGVEQGIEQGIKGLAAKLKKSGIMSVEQIADMSGLSISEVEGL